ncbi:MAG: family 43 glycosylhydrolase [Promethearchaeota archaeon]
MPNLTTVFKKFSNILDDFLFKFTRFRQILKLRNQNSLELVLNKYIANQKNIINPFKRALPLTKYSENPILREGNSGDWDEIGIKEPYILYNNKEFFLYYESCTNSNEKDWQIGVATAKKITGPWIKHPNNPILRYTNRKGDYDKQCVADPCVIFHGGKYHMWFDMYDGRKWRIGKAYSNDGINWEKLKKDGKTRIILNVGKKCEWDSKFIHCPEVYLWNNRFYMLYGAVGTGHIDYDTGLAIQNDKKGEIFKKWGQVTSDEMFGKNKIVTRMQPGFILKGIIFAGLRIKVKNSYETTYMIFSDDGGKSWNKLSEPILKSGSPKQWDSKIFYGPNSWILSEKKLWCCYLGGKHKKCTSLGLAYMNLPDIV